MIREWPLVGRSEELHMIAGTANPSGDRARGIVLSGVAGVGKTRLAREALAVCGPREAQRRWVVGTMSARSIPLGAFADIAGAVGHDSLRGVREVIDGLKVGHPDGTVLGVDDAHLLDDLSAFAVHQLVTRRLATVILTMRSGEPAPDAITALWKDRHLERLELQALSLAESKLLIGRVLGGTVDDNAAQRLWQYTEGNVLYLYHLIESELTAGRIAQTSGVWKWDGNPALSPTLAELIEARIGQVPGPIRDLLYALAVAEPLEADVLNSIADPDALLQAESLGLVRVSTHGPTAKVRLAHPMLGEIRHDAPLRLRQLRGRIATELGRSATDDPREIVRRAVLTLDSDLRPDAELLVSAASAAMQLGDSRLAETLAVRAVTLGGGLEAKIAQAIAITNQERAADAEAILSGLADQTPEMVRAQVTVFRATNFATLLGRPSDADRVLAQGFSADDETGQGIATSFRALIDAVRGHSRAAVEQADTLLARPSNSRTTNLVSHWALVSAQGDLGNVDGVESAAHTAYELASKSAASAHLRLPVATLQANAYRLAGMLTALDATVAWIQRDTIDGPSQRSWQAFFAGMSSMSRGDLRQARRALHESLANEDSGGRLLKALARSWLATVTAMTGAPAEARREFTALQWWADHADARKWDADRIIAESWVIAAENAVSQAISIVREAAVRESELGRPACEVLLLQTATQFGDYTTAGRLAQLTNEVQGPRVRAAATHAAALAQRRGEALTEASRMYEAFGDRVAAADAAAHAVVAYQDGGLPGTALTAAAVARRLAAECGGADTPALRAGVIPLPFTNRQREIISLAALGLSNKEIAEQLSISVRSVEGHLFRASQRVGANSRDQLIAMLPDTDVSWPSPPTSTRLEG